MYVHMDYIVLTGVSIVPLSFESQYGRYGEGLSGDGGGCWGRRGWRPRLQGRSRCRGGYAPQQPTQRSRAQRPRAVALPHLAHLAQVHLLGPLTYHLDT